MVVITRKQVKVLLDIMKRTDRDRLKVVRLDNGKLYCTDGYILVEIKLDTEPEHKEGKNIEIPLENLERRYKLSKSKDELYELDWITDDFAQETENQYPDCKVFFNENLQTNPQFIRINADLLKQAQDIIDSDFITISFIGDCKYLITSNEERNIRVIVMGIK